MAVLVGRTILHYRITEQVGQGGMGVVYKAEDTRLKFTVALKFLPQELWRDDDSKERFIHETQAASALVPNQYLYNLRNRRDEACPWGARGWSDVYCDGLL